MKIGILGAGQLAKMLTLAATPMGLQTLCYTDDDSHCAGFAGPLYIGSLEDYERLAAFAGQVDVVTIENENIDTQTLTHLSEVSDLYPSIEAVRLAQDRSLEKGFFQSQGIATADYRDVDSLEDLQKAVKALGLPAILKTRRFGYDGKGQIKIDNESEVTAAWQALSNQSLILEAMVPFEEEVSIIAARSVNGDCRFYPLTANTHSEGILRLSRPASAHPRQEAAEALASKALAALNYVGILAIELFVVGDKLIVNEMAPRVHNSGHWTIEGSPASQFENHLRAICDLPLGDTRLIQPTAMVNCIGEMPNREDSLAIPSLAYHDYGKAPRPGRKVGHMTLTAKSESELDMRLEGIV